MAEPDGACPAPAGTALGGPPFRSGGGLIPDGRPIPPPLRAWKPPGEHRPYGSGTSHTHSVLRQYTSRLFLPLRTEKFPWHLMVPLGSTPFLSKPPLLNGARPRGLSIIFPFCRSSPMIGLGYMLDEFPAYPRSSICLSYTVPYIIYPFFEFLLIG